jgi:hypothetical protein
MDMEPRVRPGEHARGLALVEQRQPHEQPQHGAAKCLGQPRGLVHRSRHEGPVRPEAAVRDEEVPVRMPVGSGAVRLQAGHDADGKIVLIRQRANGDGDGAGEALVSDLCDDGPPGAVRAGEAVIVDRLPAMQVV